MKGTFLLLETNRRYSYHLEQTISLNTNIKAAFDYLDSHKRIASHMSKSSWMMAGSHMDIELDQAEGHAEGSKIKMHGRMLGLHLSLEEVVTERIPPEKKIWETIGTPKLLILSQYRMGFELTPQSSFTLLRVFIDYDLPDSGIGFWLGHLLGKTYAAWCCKSMVEDAERYFR